MHEQHLNRLDLNLLRTLNVLLETRSPTKAADRLHVTQAAVSNSLSRLRVTFDDPILVRSGKEMVLTQWAEGMKTPLHRYLNDLEQLLSRTKPTQELPPTSLSIGMVSNAMIPLGPRLIPALKDIAPETTLQFHALGEQSSAQFLAGEIHLIMIWEHLFHNDPTSAAALNNPDRFGIMYSKSFPTPAMVVGDVNPNDGPVTLEEFSSMRRMSVEGGLIDGAVDFFLEYNGYSNPPAIVVEDLGHLIALLPQANTVALVAAHASDFIRRQSIPSRPAAWENPSWRQMIVWDRDHPFSPLLERTAGIMVGIWEEISSASQPLALS